MTVEAIIAEMQQASAYQTQASQALANEVAAKMGDINQALSSAVGMVSGLTRTYYVRNDGDDSNDGSSGNPFASLHKALSSVPIGGVATIYVQAAQIHTHDSVSTVDGSVITIRPWSWSGFDADKPVLMFQARQNATHNYLDAISLLNGAKLLYHSTVLDHEEKKDSSLPWSNLGSIFYTGDSEGMTPVVCLHKCEATLHSGSRLFLSAISAGTFLANDTDFKGEGTLFLANTVGMAGFMGSSYEAGIVPHSGTVYSNVVV